MNETMHFNKMRRLAGIMRRIMKIGYSLMWIGCLVGIVMLLISFRETHEKDVLILLTSKNLGVKLLPHLMNEPIDLGKLYHMSYITVIPYVIQAFIFMKMIIDVLGNVEEGKPFDSRNASSLMIIGITIIGAFFLRHLLVLIVCISYVPRFRQYINITISLADFYPIVEGMVIILVAWIFKYGCYLQQEHDETV